MKQNFILALLSFSLLISCATKKSTNQQRQTSETETTDLLIGTYTGEGSEGIYRVSFDATSGSLSDPILMAESPSPSYIAWSADKNVVYAINELDKGSVSAYQMVDDSLILINQMRTQGIHPCYVDLDEKQQLVAVANYTSGDGAVFGMGERGELIDTLFTYQHFGSGPNEKRQEGPHAHCSIFSPNGKFLYVVDLGIDQIMVYPISGENIGKGFVALQLETGDGPRHLVFDPAKSQAYVINELSNTILSVTVDDNSGKFDVISRLSTLPADFTEHSQCADIHISSDGKFLYGTNRGHNSMAVYEVDQDGMLTLVEIVPVEGDWPRNFTFSPDEKFVLVANQNSDNISVFSRDTETGKLSFTGKQLTVSKPVCLKF